MSDRINTSDPIENKLYEAWKQERKFYHIRGLSRFLIWAFALLLVDLLIDWGIIFQARLSGRMAILLLLARMIFGRPLIVTLTGRRYVIGSRWQQLPLYLRQAESVKPAADQAQTVARFTDHAKVRVG